MAGSSEPWSVDRWGRLIAGAGFLAFTLLALFHDPRWLYASLLGALNLFVTALTNRCPLHDLLVLLGAREREELFFPDGEPRGPAERPVAIPPADAAPPETSCAAGSRTEITQRS